MKNDQWTEGSRLIAAERYRQLAKWTAHHDDTHKGDLAIRAAELAVFGTDEKISDVRGDGPDPWGLIEKHEHDRLRQLVIAGALIAAAIDSELRKGEVG